MSFDVSTGDEHQPAGSLPRLSFRRGAGVVGADAARPAAAGRGVRRTPRRGRRARSEPLLAIVFLAGIAGVLGTNAFSHALDDFELDGLTLAVVAFIAGGLYGLVGYFLLGFLAYAGARAAGSDVSFGRARQIVGFAVVPLALSARVVPCGSRSTAATCSGPAARTPASGTTSSRRSSSRRSCWSARPAGRRAARVPRLVDRARARVARRRLRSGAALALARA